MPIELIINKYLHLCKSGELTFRQTCHNIDLESTNYKLVYYSEMEATFESVKEAKRRFTIRNVEEPETLTMY